MELLIRTVDKSDQPGASERGHVIACMPDGHEWSRLERSNPEWTIVRAAIVDIEAEALLAAPTDGSAHRALTIDLDGWQGDVMTRADLTARVRA